jgi:hypothetical protein
MFSGMFVVAEAEAAAIHTVYEQHGELSAGIEFRRRLPDIADNAQAQACVRAIAGWQPLRLMKKLKPRRLRRVRRAVVAAGVW